MVEEAAVLLLRVFIVLVLFFGIAIPVARLIAGTRTLPGLCRGVMQTRSARSRSTS